METKGILIAGVGGQGIIRAGDIICHVIMACGLDVKKSEVHGMAQRGGCVTSHVRYGKRVYSPIAKRGDVDILVSFEKLETLRYLDYLKKDATIIINTEELYPPAVNLGESLYPPDIIENIMISFSKVKIVNAKDTAIRAGNILTVNTVLLGALSSCMSLPVITWENALHETNIDAFHLGRAA
jgi:indolepyruvate ferredoxin oxidoreductase beta subunit